MNSYDADENAVKQLKKFGVNRADDDFWEHYDWFQKRFYEEQPVQAGLFDLNRYYYKAY